MIYFLKRDRKERERERERGRRGVTAVIASCIVNTFQSFPNVWKKGWERRKGAISSPPLLCPPPPFFDTQSLVEGLVCSRRPWYTSRKNESEREGGERERERERERGERRDGREGVCLFRRRSDKRKKKES
jgi:hypothetical protein